MFTNVVNRNARAGDLLELFFVSAVTSMLFTRLYLHIAHYPSLGGSKFHIAHMLPGGLLMLVAIVLMFSFIGHRTQRLASVVGGVGFGLFIDELGKFVTRDNNYFFHPTVAILYMLFILLFISFRALGRNRVLTQKEYLLNALALMEEAVIRDLDTAERNRVINYLHLADHSDPLVKGLIDAVTRIEVNKEVEHTWPRRIRLQAEEIYRDFITTRLGMRLVDALFLSIAIWSLASIGLSLADTLLDVLHHSVDQTAVGWLQLGSSLLASYFILRGIRFMRSSRLRAYELFTKAMLINIFVTQFFAFYREAFSALPSFFLYVLLYVALRLGISEERRIALRERPAGPATTDLHPGSAPSR